MNVVADSPGVVDCPAALVALVPRIAYRPGPRQVWALFVTAVIVDVPRSGVGDWQVEDWQRWVFQRLWLVELHEAAEFFRVDGERAFPPHGYDGVDPMWDPQRFFGPGVYEVLAADLGPNG